MDVMSFSKRTKAEAEKLLRQGDVMSILSKYGNVFVEGSYKYDLMYGPDIDLVVVADNPSEMAQAALIDFVSARKFQKYQFGDFKKYPRDKRPKSYILVLIHEYNGRRWEIEIWFHNKLPKNDIDAELERLLLNVTSQQKKTILNLKHQRETSRTSKHELDSLTIYRGVLQGNKTDIKEF